MINQGLLAALIFTGFVVLLYFISKYIFNRTEGLIKEEEGGKK